MSRLIDADALKEEVKFQQEHMFPEDLSYRIPRMIDNATTIDAIPVEWLEKRRQNLILAAMVHSTVYGDNSVELCYAVNVVLDIWQKEQEAR